MSQPYSNKPNPLGNFNDNFLEALRDLGQGVVSETKSQLKQAVNDIPQSFGLGSPSGTLQPNESFSLDQLRQAEQVGEKKAENRFVSQLNMMRDEERSRYLRQEKEAKEQIKSIQEEILMLAKSAGELNQEIQIAAKQAPVNPGIYHKNFFIHLKNMIVNIRKQVQSSKEWLSTHNGRASKQNFYWSQVGKSGTKYMLSSERYMVTSTG